jgi:hypothetical protein
MFHIHTQHVPYTHRIFHANTQKFPNTQQGIHDIKMHLSSPITTQHTRLLAALEYIVIYKNALIIYKNALIIYRNARRHDHHRSQLSTQMHTKDTNTRIITHKCIRKTQTHASSPRLPRSNVISSSSASTAITTTAAITAAPFVWGGKEAGANDICPDFVRQMCSVVMLFRLPCHAPATSTPARA